MTTSEYKININVAKPLLFLFAKLYNFLLSLL